MRSRGLLRIFAALCAAAAVSPLAGCGTPVQVSVPGQADGPMIDIGVAVDEPGVGWYHEEGYSGLSVEVAKYVAEKIGYSNRQIVFHPMTMARRDAMLADGTIDFAMTSYAYEGGKDARAFTKELASRGGDVRYSGPYLITEDELLVRSDDRASIRGVDDMRGRTACVVEDDDVREQLEQRVGGVRFREEGDFAKCVSALLAGEADAVAGSRPVLAGLRSQAGDAYVSLLDDSFGERAYGIAIAGGDGLLGQINTTLQSMIDDGTWDRIVDDAGRSLGVDADLSLNPPNIVDSRSED
ncbi:ABC transporter substrate-binding protein [Bifidobacterium italicum]|uniref:ABC transporter substrate-binding protein n=1 Tax=Bifidobacterium italicum TaxID=1960968 RepID=A0A2A2EKK1_9BIFI|nr:transporter substrate-binding domain-containing protein [Bifidobacterium italicum]PAU69517.1 ABC transporter substrate-binding protein [Bifidobacterium italicum]